MTVSQKLEQYRHDPPNFEASMGNLFKVAVFLVVWTLAVWYVSKGMAAWNWDADFKARKAALLQEEKKKWQESERQEVAQQERDRTAAAIEQAKIAASNARSAAEIAKRLASIKQTCVADAETSAGVAEILKEANQ